MRVEGNEGGGGGGVRVEGVRGVTERGLRRKGRGMIWTAAGQSVNYEP